MGRTIYSRSGLGISSSNSDEFTISAKSPLAAGQQARAIKLWAEFSITGDATGAAITNAIALTLFEFAFGFIRLDEGGAVMRNILDDLPGQIIREWGLEQNFEDVDVAVLSAGTVNPIGGVPLGSSNGTLIPLASTISATVYIRLTLTIPFYDLKFKTNPNYWAVGQSQANSFKLKIKAGGTLPATTHLTYNSYVIGADLDDIPGPDQYSNFPRPVRNNSDTGKTFSGPNNCGLCGAWERTEDLTDTTGLIGKQITLARGGNWPIHQAYDGYLLASKYYKDQLMSAVAAAGGTVGSPQSIYNLSGAEDDGCTPFFWLPIGYQLSDIPDCHSISVILSGIPSGIVTYDAVFRVIPQHTEAEIHATVGPNMAKGRGPLKLIFAPSPVPLGAAARTFRPMVAVGVDDLPHVGGWHVDGSGAVRPYMPPHLSPHVAAGHLPGLSRAQSGTAAGRQRAAKK